MDHTSRGRSPSAGRANHLSRPSSASPHPHLASPFNAAADTTSALRDSFEINPSDRFSFQAASCAYDPTFDSGIGQQPRFSLDHTFVDFQQQQQQQQQERQQQQQAHLQPDSFANGTFGHAQAFQTSGASTDSSAFPSFDITQPLYDDTTGLDLTDFDSDPLDLLSQSTSPSGLDGSLVNNNGNLNPMASTMSPPHSQTPPHLLQPDMVHQPSNGPNANASPHFGQTSFSPVGRPRNLSESLGPASAMYPQGQNEWASMNMGPYQHRRIPSDNVSEISSANVSPYLNTLDTFDGNHVHSSPLLNAHNDPTFSDGLGLQQFSLADNNLSEQSFHTPGASPGHSPHLMPQQALPPFTAENNYGLNASMNGHFGAPPNGLDLYNTTTSPEPFPPMSSQSPGGLSEATSPPAINISFAPSQMNPMPTLKTENSDDALMPPSRSNRVRAKSDSHAGPRPASPFMRGRSPSLQPHSPQASDNLEPFDSRPSSRASSPGVRGRPQSSGGGGGGGVGDGGRARSTSHSDHRKYLLDLAKPERSPSAHSGTSDATAAGAGARVRVQKHPATYQCTLCPKRFTRAYNLRSHLRTHTDERPFVCTVCGKAFARQHDRKRHEGLHSGEKKFVCRGQLLHTPAGVWGCGRRFARADALGRHFRSEAGRVCIKPLLDEEAAERQRAAMEQHHQQQQQQQQQMQMAAAPPAMDVMAGFLPQAILQQYPALATIDWSQVAPGGGSGQDDEYSGAGGGGRSSYDGTSGNESYYEDASEGEMGGFGGAHEPGINGINGGPASMSQHQQHTHLPVQQPLGFPMAAGGGRSMYPLGATAHQPGDYMSDLEGR